MLRNCYRRDKQTLTWTPSLIHFPCRLIGSIQQKRLMIIYPISCSIHVVLVRDLESILNAPIPFYRRRRRHQMQEIILITTATLKYRIAPLGLVQIFMFYKRTANASALLLSAKEGAEPSQIDSDIQQHSIKSNWTIVQYLFFYCWCCKSRCILNLSWIVEITRQIPPLRITTVFYTLNIISSFCIHSSIHSHPILFHFCGFVI